MALVLSFLVNKFLAKFNFELNKNLFLKKVLDLNSFSFFIPSISEKSQIELQNLLGFFILQFKILE